jgi:phosphoglycerate dehydrogenase-like enzyme
MPVLYVCPQFLKSDPEAFAEDCDSLRVLRDIAKGYEVVLGGRDIPEPIRGDVEIIFGVPDASALPLLPSLKWLQLSIAGSDRYCARSLYARSDVILTNSSGVFGRPISEYVIAVFLMMSKDLHVMRDNRDKALWFKYPLTCDFEGSTVGVIGLGDIGGNVARKAHLLGAKVLAVKNTPSPKPDYVDELHTADGFDGVLARSDFVALCLPSTSDTRHIISKRHFDVMKRSAILVNVGRGTAIDQDALVEALRGRKIAGAGLDVTTPEPLPAEHPLWKLDNCFISPHNSSNSYYSTQRIVDLFTQNLHRYIKGETLGHLVDMEKGY